MSHFSGLVVLTVMARTSSKYDHFDFYLTPVTLTFNLPKNVSNGTLSPRWHQLCKIILKSMQKCTSYAPDTQYMYMTILTFIWTLWHCPSIYQKHVSNHTFPLQGQQLYQIILKSMHYCTSYGPDKFGRTHAHCNNNVSLIRKRARQNYCLKQDKILVYYNFIYVSSP